MHYKTLIYDRHILIQLLILLEKAKYYYFMDIAHLSLELKITIILLIIVVRILNIIK